MAILTDFDISQMRQSYYERAMDRSNSQIPNLDNKPIFWLATSTQFEIVVTEVFPPDLPKRLRRYGVGRSKDNAQERV